MSEDQNKATRWISLRVKPSEYAIIHGYFSNTTCRKLSEYIRNILLQKPVVVRYRSQSADDFLLHMLDLKRELNAIGNNYNQAVKKLHTLDDDAAVRRWLEDQEQTQCVLIAQQERMFVQIDELHRQWLSGLPAPTV